MSASASVRQALSRSGFEQVDQVPSPVFQEVFESVRDQLEGFRVLALVGLDGLIIEQGIVDATLNRETLSEFATILRITKHTCESTAAGQLSEMCWIADRWLVVTQRVSGERFLILVTEPGPRFGFARFLLRRAAWELRPQIDNPPS